MGSGSEENTLENSGAQPQIGDLFIIISRESWVCGERVPGA
jgi:hypothetical protein